METFRAVVHSASRIIDGIAGLLLVGVASLVVSNILLRTLLSRPIIGTYETVGYLTAAAIGLSLAQCAVQNSHIAVDFLVSRLAERYRKFIEAAVTGPVIVFLLLVTYHLGAYTARIIASGEVSPTAQLPFYPFIFMVALGFLLLSMVLLLRLWELLAGKETSL